MITQFLNHFFEHAELYTVALVWIVVPLFTYALYLFVEKRYGIFTPTIVQTTNKSKE